MSQAGVLNLAAGPVPPAVPTQFTADDATIGIPVANNLNLFSRDTTDNNDNGIQTTADPNGSANYYVEVTNRTTGTTTTANATPTTVITFPLGATPGVYYFTGQLVAFDTTDTAGAAYSFESAVRTTGAAGIEIASEDKTIFEEAAMTAADFAFSVSANNATLEVTGIIAKSINWNCLLTYRFVS